jgi:predicted DNA-binding transcriptional regulator AlpA
MDNASLRKLLTPKQVSELSGLSVSYLAKMRMRSDGASYCKIGASVRYPEEAVRRWLDAVPVRRSTFEKFEPSAA